MKLIESKAELITQPPDLQGVYQMIELAGRTCYKSEANITKDSATEFVNRMIKSYHYAMLEHGTVYLLIPYWNTYEDTELASFFKHNPYSKVHGPMEDSINWYITTNYRVLVENNLVDRCMPLLCAPTKYHSLRITMRFITSIGITRELIRHRVFSFANESTRYCNYNSSKFGKEITFIMPNWYKAKENKAKACFVKACEDAESLYLSLLDQDMAPQQAREVLPLCTKSEIIMTGFASDWMYFFKLRHYGTTGKPHPDMLELTGKAIRELEKTELWQLILKEQ